MAKNEKQKPKPAPAARKIFLPKASILKFCREHKLPLLEWCEQLVAPQIIIKRLKDAGCPETPSIWTVYRWRKDFALAKTGFRQKVDEVQKEITRKVGEDVSVDAFLDSLISRGSEMIKDATLNDVLKAAEIKKRYQGGFDPTSAQKKLDAVFNQ